MLKFKKMGTDKVPLLLVTANVGSIFEEPSVMLPIWTAEFLQAVSRMDPKFIALHLQEVGGKAYEKSMQYVKDFVQRLTDCPELRLFDKIRIFLDEDFSSPEKFTALGNMYFAHSSLSELKIWDFELSAFVDVQGREVHSGNIEKATTKEKAKFPQHFFPECKWSRKGYLRTRWMIRGTAVEFVNIHLFHDASNLLAMEPFPSVYCRSRRRALRHTLRRLHADPHAAPYFLFGDFNFRPDTGAVVEKVTKDMTSSRQQNSDKVDSSKLQFRCDERVVLTVGKKEFSHVDHQKLFREPWLQRYDRELEALKPHLYEFPVKFPPSYPFEENPQLPTHYMKTRCPAWCDRVLLSQTARLLIQHNDAARPAENRHLHSSRKSVVDTDSSGRASSSDSSPARSASPHRENKQTGKTLEKKSSVADLDALSVPGINVSRKSIADPTSIQHAINYNKNSEPDGSPVRRKLVRNQSEGSPKPECGLAELRRLVDAPRKRAEYGVIGDTACMGDHKPIYLRVLLQSERGSLPPAPSPPHSPPVPHVEITRVSYNNDVYINDIDTTLLSARQCLDPYTPESIDSHTPNQEGVSSGSELSDIGDVLGGKVELIATFKLSRDRSVSPTQLKNRLDKLLEKNSKLERLNSRESCKSGASKAGLCCLALKCIGFCRRSASKVDCTKCSSDCCTS